MMLTKKNKLILVFMMFVVLISLIGYRRYEVIKIEELQRKQAEEDTVKVEKIQKQKEVEVFQKLLDSLDPNKEEENIKIDEYNFQQLEKVKVILAEIVSKGEKFPNSGISKFNVAFKQNIVPKRNCYYIGTFNGNERYIFGFKLESKRYISLYKEVYFAYPKYSMPVDEICTGTCYDYVLEDFKQIISNPCKD